MIKRISERNVLHGTSLFTEYQKIEYLFSENRCIGRFNKFGAPLPSKFTLEQYLNDFAFSGWHLRGTAISFYNLRDELGLSKEKIREEFNNDIFVDFMQLCLNSVLRIEMTLNNHSNAFYISDKNLLSNIIDNCECILESLNYSCKLDEETSEVFVYEKNPIATAVAETNEDIANSLIEYGRHNIKGNLKRKGEILCTLYKKLESIEKRFKGTEYEKLASDTKFLFNKTGIRHCMEKDKFASKTFMEMSVDQLEEWYDNTYYLFLSCMVIFSYLELKNKIEEIKRAGE